MNEPSKLRIWLSWTVGITIVLMISISLGLAAESFDLPTSVYGWKFDYSGDYYEGDQTTSLGWLIHVIAITIGIRVGKAVYHNSLNGGVGQKGNVQLIIFVVCIAVIATIDTVIWKNFEREIRGIPNVVFNGINMFYTLGIGYLGYRYYLKRICKLGLQ